MSKSLETSAEKIDVQIHNEKEKISTKLDMLQLLMMSRMMSTNKKTFIKNYSKKGIAKKKAKKKIAKLSKRRNRA